MINHIRIFFIIFVLVCKGYASCTASSVDRATFIDQIFKKEKFSLISSFVLGKGNYSLDSSLITRTEWEELQCDFLLEKLDRTRTSFGPWGLKQLLIPIVDKDEIEKRQAIIKIFLENEAIYKEVVQLLHVIKKTEKSLLVYWNEKDTLSIHVNRLYYSVLGFEKQLNNNVLALDISVIVEAFMSIKSLLSELCLKGIITESSEWLFGEKEKFDFFSGIKRGLQEPLRQHSFIMDDSFVQKLNIKKTATNKDWFRAQFFGSLGDRVLWTNVAYSNANIFMKAFFYGQAFIPTIMYDICWYNNLTKSYKYIIFLKKTIDQIRTRMMDIGLFIRAVDKLSTILKQNSVFFQLQDVMSFENNNSLLLYNCINELRTDTFDPKKKSLYLYSRGRVLMANKLLHDSKDDFVPALQAIALLDGYVSIASLYKECIEKEIPISFVSLQDGDNPILELNDAWTPLLIAQEGEIVTNSIEFGIGTTPIKAIITGPHGGGKSIALNMVGHAIILSHSWGIVPADCAQISLFSGLKTVLETHDDQQNNLSGYMAQHKRMQACKEFINTSTKSKKKIVLINEPENNTIYEESPRILYDFGLGIKDNQYAVAIITTHVKKPTELSIDTNNLFANYHVEIIEQNIDVMHVGSNKKFKRTFKIKPGIAEWWFDNTQKRRRFFDWLKLEMQQNKY